MIVEGTVENTLKEGGTEKRGGETKILKKGGKLGQGVDALKKGELEPPCKLWSTFTLALTLMLENNVDSAYAFVFLLGTWHT